VSPKKLPSEITKVLKESHFAYFCTTDKNNQVHITPMFFLFDEETNGIFVFAYSKSKKLKNIRVNPKVCLTVDVRDPENPFNNRGVMVQGEAIIEKIVDSISPIQDEKLRKIYKDFSEKYPILSEARSPDQVKYQKFREVLIRVRANKMVYWKGPHFVTVNFDRESGLPVNVVEK